MPAMPAAPTQTNRLRASEAPTFQEMILRLQQYWANLGCLIWQPTNTEVGAGTMNPATFLRVLGPEPWHVAYVEPSVRPDDSRYGENPNRIQMHTQFQVILKPDPEDPQERYLASLEVLGIDRSRHDIRFVEDNWESPALGAWGLGWEVWLDGQEITQFTYFQQAGGITLDPVAVEITYGLERIAMTLQGMRHFKDIQYAPGITYGDVLAQNEYEMSVYNLDRAHPDHLAQLFGLYEAEAQRLLAHRLVLPAYSYLLKTSHAFNLLDARGAVGVTERTSYFSRMRDLARKAAHAWVEQRQELGFPLLKPGAQSPTTDGEPDGGSTVEPSMPSTPEPLVRAEPSTGNDADFVLEIGCEELPAADVDTALAHLERRLLTWLAERRLSHGTVRVEGTPRRLVILVAHLQASQRDEEQLLKGPPVQVAFNADQTPTKAALGFARSRGIDVSQLRLEEIEGGTYAVARVRVPGRRTAELLAEEMPALIHSIPFAGSMRWNASNVTFSRPVRWLLALFGDEVVSFRYADIPSGRTSRGLRPLGSPLLHIPSASAYSEVMATAGVVLDREARATAIHERCRVLAGEVNGTTRDDPDLLMEISNLVESPIPIRGSFNQRYLSLPREVLVTVMRKHQRYVPVEAAAANGPGARLLPFFIAVANGPVDTPVVRQGNEEVLEARYADAAFFWDQDRRQPLAAWRSKLAGLTYQAQLGSLLDKSERIAHLTRCTGAMIGLDGDEQVVAQRIAHLAKADLVTQMVMEFTSLQGTMGREYARESGESEEVAAGIFEHYLPRHAGDSLPQSRAAIAVGLADRLDSLAGLFAAGLAPRSTADPFALRRTALGLIQVLAERSLPFDLRQGIAEAAAVQPLDVSQTVQQEVLNFIRRRLEQWLLERGYRPDLVQAVLAARRDDPARALAAVQELHVLAGTERFQRILRSYARPARLMRGRQVSGRVDPALFEHDAERVLWDTLEQVARTITPDSAVSEFNDRFAPLVEPIDTFFTQVFVMVEDEELRDNRLALLKQVTDLPSGIVDLTQIRGF